MRERTPEQMSIFDVMPELEKPEDFYLQDSFSGHVKGLEEEKTAFENAAYIGERDLPNSCFTIYVRRIRDKKRENDRFIVSVPSIGFDFGYNSMEKLLSEWDISKEKLNIEKNQMGNKEEKQ